MVHRQVFFLQPWFSKKSVISSFAFLSSLSSYHLILLPPCPPPSSSLENLLHGSISLALFWCLSWPYSYGHNLSVTPRLSFEPCYTASILQCLSCTSVCLTPSSRPPNPVLKPIINFGFQSPSLLQAWHCTVVYK